MKILTKAAFVAAALTASTLPLQSAQAATTILNLTGVQSFDEFGEAANVVRLLNIGAGSHVTGLTFSTTITTIGASWLSEAQIYYTDSLISDGVIFTPGIGNDLSGSMSFSGTSDLLALGLDFFVGADGILRVEFAEEFDDVFGAADANWAGSLTFTYTPVTAPAVPEPASWAMMIGGLGLTGAAMRRRKSMTVRFA